jgi:hypothetical protein
MTPNQSEQEEIVARLRARSAQQAEADLEPVRAKQREFAPLIAAARTALEQAAAFRAEHGPLLRTMQEAVADHKPDSDGGVEQARRRLRGALGLLRGNLDAIEEAGRYVAYLDALTPPDLGEPFLPNQIGTARERLREAVKRVPDLAAAWVDVSDAWVALTAGLSGAGPVTPRLLPLPDLPEGRHLEPRHAISRSRPDDDEAA